MSPSVSHQHDAALFNVTRELFETEKQRFLDNMEFTRTQRLRVKNSWLTFNNHKTCFGMAHWDGKVEISKAFVRMGFGVWDTIVHELAHIAAGIDHGHDDVWINIYRALGGEGGATCEVPADMLPPAKWTLKCTSCSWSYPRYRRNYKYKGVYICCECDSPMKFKHN